MDNKTGQTVWYSFQSKIRPRNPLLLPFFSSSFTLFDFIRLHVLWTTCKLSRMLVPPFDTGIMWSMCRWSSYRLSGCLQSAHSSLRSLALFIKSLRVWKSKGPTLCCFASSIASATVLVKRRSLVLVSVALNFLTVNSWWVCIRVINRLRISAACSRTIFSLCNTSASANVTTVQSQIGKESVRLSLQTLTGASLMGRY